MAPMAPMAPPGYVPGNSLPTITNFPLLVNYLSLLSIYVFFHVIV